MTDKKTYKDMTCEEFSNAYMERLSEITKDKIFPEIVILTKEEALKFDRKKHKNKNIIIKTV